MSWKVLVDRRDGKFLVDWPRLIVVLGAAEVLGGFMVWSTTGHSAGAVAAYVVLLLVAFGLAALVVGIQGRRQG